MWGYVWSRIYPWRSRHGITVQVSWKSIQSWGGMNKSSPYKHLRRWMMCERTCVSTLVSDRGCPICQGTSLPICNSQHKLRYGQGGPHQNMVLWLRLDYPICELPTWEFPRRVWYLNLSRVSFPALRLTARLLGSTCPVHFSRTFASTACAISDPLSCHVAYGSPIGLAFVVYWGIVLFGYDTYVQKLHSHWMIDIWLPS